MRKLQILEGLETQDKEFGFYFHFIGKALECFEQRIIIVMFLKTMLAVRRMSNICRGPLAVCLEEDDGEGSSAQNDMKRPPRHIVDLKKKNQNMSNV